MKTILLVDDDPAIREIFTEFLETGGYRVFTLSGGLECLELVKTTRPDLILLDLMMEPMDGWETLLAIRHDPVTGQIPVIVVTGKKPEPAEIVQYGSLIEDFIVKPVEFGTIIASLNSVIEKDLALHREIERMVRNNQDPALLNEYADLLRLVRITYHIKRMFKDHQFAERTLIRSKEKRLKFLHDQIGFPDRFLERDYRR
jgi:CheY-like chemotaxis protein